MTEWSHRWDGQGLEELGWENGSVLAAAAASPNCGSLGSCSAWDECCMFHMQMDHCPGCAAGIFVHFW